MVIGLAIFIEHSLADSNQQIIHDDFGYKIEKLLHKKSEKLFGIKKPLIGSANASASNYRNETQKAADQVLLAKSLKAEYVTRHVANKSNMIVFWPSLDNPTHLIACIEDSREEITPGKLNPSVQHINIDSDDVTTILRGMDACDGIRRTQWGTILVTEERSDGGAYEIIDPLNVVDETIIDRASGDVTAPFNIAKRTSLPTMSWEGLTILDNGVVIGGDELRPGTSQLDDDGGAIFKFVPETFFTSAELILDLKDSLLVSGSVYALTVSCREKGSANFPQYGQGCEIGQGAWVKVNAATARNDANSKGATGYYRPEDLHRDLMYSGEGVRFCWANTGREQAENYGEVLCSIDHDLNASSEITDTRTGYIYLANAANKYASITTNRFVEGDTDFNSVDNLAFQPHTGNLYVIEYHPDGDIFACLPDGVDRDIKTDGCVKILSVKDSSAEPTGFIFSSDGKSAYLSIQHSDDGNMRLFDDYPTDDILRITGFRVNK